MARAGGIVSGGDPGRTARAVIFKGEVHPFELIRGKGGLNPVVVGAGEGGQGILGGNLGAGFHVHRHDHAVKGGFDNGSFKIEIRPGQIGFRPGNVGLDLGQLGFPQGQVGIGNGSS